MTLGEYVLSYRTAHGMSQREFAKISGISNQYISLVEKGLNNDGKPLSPTMDTYRKVADATNVSINELLMIVSDNITVNTIYSKRPSAHIDNSALSEAELNELFMQLIEPLNKDQLVKLAYHILEIAASK